MGDPLPPPDQEEGDIWFIPRSEWLVQVTFLDGTKQVLTVIAPFAALAAIDGRREAEGLYPEGGGVDELIVKFKGRLYSV